MRTLLLLLVLTSVAHAREQYAGEYDGLDPATRAWFKGVKSPRGVPCCDIADGHKTTFKVDSEGHFIVPIEGEWHAVPPEAIVYDAGNPYEEAVVWYSKTGGVGEDGKMVVYIRCFVPSGGV